MNVLDLFSGIGGFSLGLERAGMRTVAFCEIEPYCRAVLEEHWPHVPIYGDVRELTGDRLRADGISVDVICGGFPCQDVSLAGKGAGLAGERSGLWREYARIIGEVRPRFVIVENVAALLSRGLGDVLGDLAALGFDAEWHCIPASAVGAPHRRDRVWIIAYARGEQHESGCLAVAGAASKGFSGSAMAYADRCRWAPGCDLSRSGHGHSVAASGRHVVCNAALSRLALGQSIRRDDVEKFAATIGADWWATEPDVGRVANGVSSRVDRLKGLGNAVVPQIPEIIGRAIMRAAQ